MTALLDAHALSLAERLQPTDLAMAEPQLLCLVGPNGSGKTSLLHAIAKIGGAAGRVRVEGADVDRLGPAARKRALAYLPASRDVAWPLAARDLVRLGQCSEGSAEEAMAAMGVADLRHRRMDRLSSGERSRVLIARALAQRPKLLLLDEPAANLDPAWQLRLMMILKDAARRQGVIAAMHDLDLAARFADRMVVMNQGAVAADGEPEALIDGAALRSVFGVARGADGWRLVSPSEGPRSLP